MLFKIVKTTALLVISGSLLSAGSFNVQAEKDRKALITYMEKKFSDPVKNKGAFFPYSTDKELKGNFKAGIKRDEFQYGSYAYDKSGRSQFNDIEEMPPYEDAIDEGEELYNASKALKGCFPDPTIAGDYPKFDEKSGKVVTITLAINQCLKAGGEKTWKLKKGKMAKVEAFLSSKTKEAGKKVNIVIESEAAAKAYEAGKKAYYSQRGYLKLSCASCHVQGTGQRVRREYMSPLLGHTTHFPVFRLKWQGLGTLERRIEGCNKDEGENPHKVGSEWMSNVLYFMAYMSNEMPIDGPSIRK